MVHCITSFPHVKVVLSRLNQLPESDIRKKPTKHSIIKSMELSEYCTNKNKNEKNPRCYKKI